MPPFPSVVGDPFFPTTLLQWVQVISPVLTLAAVFVAVFAVYKNGRWRHQDHVDERKRLAAHVRTNAVYDEKEGVAVLSEIRLYNGGGEIIKEAVVDILDDAGRALELEYGTLRVNELLLSHLGPGGEKKWEISATPPATKVVAEGSFPWIVHVRTRVRWTDAAGWKWQMEGNRSLTRIEA
jgi:hypothetical protein